MFFSFLVCFSVFQVLFEYVVCHKSNYKRVPRGYFCNKTFWVLCYPLFMERWLHIVVCYVSLTHANAFSKVERTGMTGQKNNSLRDTFGGVAELLFYSGRTGSHQSADCVRQKRCSRLGISSLRMLPCRCEDSFFSGRSTQFLPWERLWQKPQSTCMAPLAAVLSFFIRGFPRLRLSFSFSSLTGATTPQDGCLLHCLLLTFSGGMRRLKSSCVGFCWLWSQLFCISGSRVYKKCEIHNK